MLGLCRLIFGMVIDLLRSRVALEAEILVLRQQINVLRRTRPRRHPFVSIDRLILGGVCRLFPKMYDALAIVRPDTVIRWHCAGFRSVLALEIESPLRPTDCAVGNSPNIGAHASGQSAISGRSSLSANQTTSFFFVSGFGSGAYSAKLLTGTRQRFSGFSQPRTAAPRATNAKNTRTAAPLAWWDAAFWTYAQSCNSFGLTPGRSTVSLSRCNMVPP